MYFLFFQIIGSKVKAFDVWKDTNFIATFHHITIAIASVIVVVEGGWTIEYWRPFIPFSCTYCLIDAFLWVLPRKDFGILFHHVIIWCVHIPCFHGNSKLLWSSAGCYIVEISSVGLSIRALCKLAQKPMMYKWFSIYTQVTYPLTRLPWCSYLLYYVWKESDMFPSATVFWCCFLGACGNIMLSIVYTLMIFQNPMFTTLKLKKEA